MVSTLSAGSPPETPPSLTGPDRGVAVPKENLTTHDKKLKGKQTDAECHRAVPPWQIGRPEGPTSIRREADVDDPIETSILRKDPSRYKDSDIWRSQSSAFLYMQPIEKGLG